jgi:2'-5' RNA ligase
VRLFAALVPPASEVDRAKVLAATVSPLTDADAAPVTEGRHRAGERRWFRRRRAPEPAPVGPMLNLVPTAAVHVPLTKFGNLAMDDARRLADELALSAQEWASPRLRLAGGFTRAPEGKTSVWVRLTGDLDEVRDLIRGIAHVSQGLHLFIDRRNFEPEVQLGSANEHTTTAYLESLVTELAGFESNAWWQSNLSLLIANEEGTGPVPFRPFREIALGPAVAH